MAEINDGMIQRARINDELLAVAVHANEEFAALPAHLQEAWENQQKLMGYYYAQWRDDFESLRDDPRGFLHVLSEDGIWNSMSDFCEAIKKIEETAARIREEYEAFGSDGE